MALEYLPDRRAMAAADRSRRIGPQFVRALASRIRCSSTGLKAHGHDPGTGRRGAKHEKSSRPASSLSFHRCQAVLTVFGEHAIDRPIWRNDSPA
jgi:hypothetical protein